jgi:small-conductance mechanosensitive channel
MFAPQTAPAPETPQTESPPDPPPAESPEPEPADEAGAEATGEATGGSTDVESGEASGEASGDGTLSEAADEVAGAAGDMAAALSPVRVPEASDLPEDPSTPLGEGAEQAAKLIHDLHDISFLRIGLIVAGTWGAIWLIRRLLPYLADRGPSQLRLTLLGAVPIARLGLLTLAILWVAQLIFVINLQNFFFVAGVVSVAVGFAFKDYVSSLIAGVVAVFERPYRPGDWIKLGDDYGEVTAVGLRTVTLRTPADDVIAAPHARIWTENVANSNDGSRTLMCIADFYLAPGHDADRVRAALYDVAFTSAYLGYGKPVAVMLKQTPWGTHYKVKAYPFDMRDQFAFVSDLTVRGKRAVADAGGAEVAAPAAGPLN